MNISFNCVYPYKKISFKRNFIENPDCYRLRGNITLGDHILKGNRNFRMPTFLEQTAARYYDHFNSGTYMSKWKHHPFSLDFISSLKDHFLLPGEKQQHKQLVKYCKNSCNDLVLIIRKNNITDDVYIKDDEGQKFEDMPFIVFLIDRKHSNEMQATSDPCNPIYKLAKLVFTREERLLLLKDKENKEEKCRVIIDDTLLIH